MRMRINAVCGKLVLLQGVLGKIAHSDFHRNTHPHDNPKGKTPNKKLLLSLFTEKSGQGTKKSSLLEVQYGTVPGITYDTFVTICIA